MTDYYYLDGDGVPCLLAHAKGDAQLIDLDGDGINELCAASGASGQIFFQRDSRFYEADVKSLLQDAWPELRYWESAQWDVSYRRMTVSASAGMPEWADAEHRDPSATAVRYVYYRDGELLVYKPDAAEATDHVVGTPDVPEAVVAAAKATVLEAYQSARTEGYNAGAEFDDWRVEYLAEDWSQTYSGGTLVAYNMNYEYHAGKPAAIMLAGGAYVDEDGWCMPDYPYCHYLLFAEKDGQYTFLKEQMINDGGPGTPFFEAEMLWLAADAGLTSLTDAAPEELLSQLYDGSGGRFLTYLSAMSETDRQTVCQKLDVILQEGTAEQQSLYLDAVQTMAWCSHSFDGAQREAYDYFLEHSARSSQAAQQAQQIMDALVSEGTITLEYWENGSVNTRALDPTQGVTPLRAAAFSDSFFWAEAAPIEDGALPEPKLTLSSRNGDITVTVWGPCPQVYCVYQDRTYAFLAAGTATGFDGDRPFTYLRKWYDDAKAQ